jgi:hypothetical protein
MTAGEKLRSLVFPVCLFTSRSLDLVVLASLAILFFFTFKKTQRGRLQTVWLVACAVLLAAYFVAPGEYGFGGYVDVRILPFIYLFLLAIVRFERVPGFLPICLALLALFRVATVEKMFMERQSEAQRLTASFDAIPRDAKVLSFVKVTKDDGLAGRGDVHHLEYGTIQRGFLVPTLFHLSGVQPIQLVDSVYCANVFCSFSDAAGADWKQIAKSYDFLWVHNDAEIAPYASRVAQVVFTNDSVVVYRVQHSAAE